MEKTTMDFYYFCPGCGKRYINESEGYRFPSDILGKCTFCNECQEGLVLDLTYSMANLWGEVNE